MATSITNTSITTDNLTVDTDTIHVDSTNNRVGIGTASPNNPLEIAHTGSVGAGGLRIGDPSTIASDTGIYLRTTGDAVIGAAGGNIVFDTNMAVQEDMRIDTNGYVTMPNQPGCMIYCQSQDINWVAGTQILYGNNGATSNTSIKAWDTTNSFNMTNSQYTAPVAGKYYVSFTANGVYASGVVPRAYVRVNGSDIGHGQHIRGNNAITSDLDHRTYAGIISLAANDIVTVYAAYGTWDTFGCNYFCIYKLS